MKRKIGLNVTHGYAVLFRRAVRGVAGGGESRGEVGRHGGHMAGDTLKRGLQLSARAALAASGALPENVNYAVKSW
jgi:hypothetical protein